MRSDEVRFQKARLPISVAVAVIVFFCLGSAASAMTVTPTGDSGACTLRGAIQAAAANNSGTPCGPVVSGGGVNLNTKSRSVTRTVTVKK